MNDPTSTHNLSAGVVCALALLVLAGCTTTPEKPPPADNPIVQEHMKNIEMSGITLARAIDEGDTVAVATSAGLMANQFLHTRGIPPARKPDGPPVNLTAYNQLLDKSLEDLHAISQAARANYYAVIAGRYTDLRTRCVTCHAAFVDRPIPFKLPVPRNF